MEKLNLVTDKYSKSPVAEAYRTIRTNIKFAGNSLKTILLTSATPNEGKSTTIANLGVVMAQAGNKVCILDCDMRNPTQYKAFAVANVGISNMFASDETVDNVLVQTDVENLWLIPAGPVPPNPSELLASSKMDIILRELHNRFDYVLVDTPPVMPVTDPSVLASKVDGVILIIDSGEVSPQICKEAKVRLEQACAHIVGVVLNKVDIASHSYHGSGYGYYSYYGNDESKKD